jgi:hypothetical protein
MLHKKYFFRLLRLLTIRLLQIYHLNSASKETMETRKWITLPSREDVKRITENFLIDLKSFTVTDTVLKEIRPIVCSVCDSIPTKAGWSTFVDMDEFIKLCGKCKLKRTDCLSAYCEKIRKQYMARDPRLEQFILSPETYVNEQDEVLVCRQCLLELRKKAKQKNVNRRCPPPESIINGYMIGDAPHELKSLNPVELSLITKTATQCQSWIFFAGCHQHIKGWHTFFRGRSGENIGNLTLMTESGWKGQILVVMCGPFTSEQSKLTRQRTNVDPQKVIAGWKWLKKNNFRYQNVEIPNIEEIPLPYIIDNER